MSSKCSLYIIVNPTRKMEGHSEGMAKGLFCKIGIAGNVESRFIQLDTHVDKLEIVAEYVVDGRQACSELEQLIHKLLAKQNVRGEWFYLTNGQMIALDNCIMNFIMPEVHYHEKKYLDKKISVKDYLCVEPPYVNGE